MRCQVFAFKSIHPSGRVVGDNNANQLSLARCSATVFEADGKVGAICTRRFCNCAQSTDVITRLRRIKSFSVPRDSTSYEPPRNLPKFAAFGARVPARALLHWLTLGGHLDAEVSRLHFVSEPRDANAGGAHQRAMIIVRIRRPDAGHSAACTHTRTCVPIPLKRGARGRARAREGPSRSKRLHGAEKSRATNGV